jgi:DNA-binding NarL/FixJ family response regulator
MLPVGPSEDTGGMAVVKVLIIEDESFTRSLLTAALAGPLLDVHSGHSAKYALDTAAAEGIEVAILDLDLGGGPTGIDIAHALRAAHPHIGLVLLTSYSDPRLSGPDERALPLGTRYLTKSSLSDLNQLITVILQAKSEPLKFDKKSSVTRTELTDHQIEVFRAIAQGTSNAEIAKSLGISEKAVENTVTRIIDVLGIRKDSTLNPRVQLVREFSSLAGKKIPG